MAVLNYTTTVPVTKTVGEVQALLASNGASRVAIEYEDGAAVGVTFSLTTPHGPRVFTLPVDVDAMHRLILRQDDDGLLKSGGMSRANRRSRGQAERVAWRVIKDWLAAQLALVATQMASLDQVMLPYLHVDENRTLYAAYRQREDHLLAIEGA